MEKKICLLYTSRALSFAKDTYNKDITIILDHIPEGCDYEMGLYDEEGNQVVIWKENGNGGLSITIPNWNSDNRGYTAVSYTHLIREILAYNRTQHKDIMSELNVQFIMLESTIPVLSLIHILFSKFRNIQYSTSK